METKLLYLEALDITAGHALVIDVLRDPVTEKIVIILNQTPFYPQGGGQPYDQGTISHDASQCVVEQVRFVDGLVRHIGRFEYGMLQPGNEVSCMVDTARRALHSRLHSAGHVVDMAVAALGLPWTPGKGYHFPEGPYVEYRGSLSDAEKVELPITIETLCNQFIAQALATKLLFLPVAELSKVCRFVPENLPENKPSRVVLYGDFGVPCGGTHVSNLADIGHMTIRKIKIEKGMIRVSYAVFQQDG